MGDKEIIRDDIYDELEEGLSYSNGEVQIDDPQAVLIHDKNFCPIITELVKNCLDKGATKVTVNVDWGRIVVEDDVVHTQAELEKILANVTSERPRSTKGPDPGLNFSISGVGILSVRSDLARYGGLLNYEVTEEGRMKAVTSWPTLEKHPL